MSNDIQIFNNPQFGSIRKLPARRNNLCFVWLMYARYLDYRLRE